MSSLAKQVRYLRGYISAFSVLCLLPHLASAQAEAEQLLEKARCYACHQATETLLGPPYQAIAARHAPRKEVMIDVLARKIVHGGGGNWGVVPMVPNQWVSIEEARIMAEWILSLAKEE